MGPASVTPDEGTSRYFYPNGNPRMACPPDNDGFPTCMGDDSMGGYSPELKQQVCVNLAGD